MIDLQKKGPAGAACRGFPEKGGFRRALDQPGSGRRAGGARKTEANQPPAGHGGGAGVRRRAVVEWAWVDGRLDCQKGKNDQQSENGAGLLALSFLHRAHDIL